MGTTAQDLTKLCTSVDAKLNETGQYFDMSKFLMTHHALELAQREPTISAFAVNPGVAVLASDAIPDWIKRAFVHFPYPEWVIKRMPSRVQSILRACNTNEAGLDSCPQTYAQGAAPIVAAAAWTGISNHSGSYLDFHTEIGASNAHGPYGPFTQQDPTCKPRDPPPMNQALRSAWYTEMLRIMGGIIVDDVHPKTVLV